ncbi:hypothetical protein H8E88_19555 [candidate division KSB1 bacterium]|nr:hypothetical protein [candidate division KSB1 bacterium]MBL7093162.1 hypothetical protein [candidate division KSB1 bacterium]
MKNKNIIISLILIFSFLAISALSLFAQNQATRDIIQGAMRDEIKRNIDKLRLENLQDPFFISYTIHDARTMEITASLGSIINSNKNHYRNHHVRLMVGDYNLNDENYFDLTGGGYRQTMLRGADRLPLEDNYSGIRRALWIATDNLYKSATESFERKKAALEQQTLSEEDKALADFSKTEVVKQKSPPIEFDMDQEKWEKIARELSGIFTDYSDIYSSQLRIFFYQSDIFFTNSEGTETNKPLSLVAVQINASTQAEDGEPLKDHVIYYGAMPGDLPPLKSMKDEIIETVKSLIALKSAPVFEDSYTGPVMFSNQATAEFFAQRLFSGSSGLISSRKPVVGDPRAASFLNRGGGEQLEDRIDTRIISRDITIKALPTMDNFSGEKLIGGYQVDEEGVKPPEEVVLVERGVLKTLLSNRILTKKISQSNGHERPLVGAGTVSSSGLGPSVINVTSSNGMTETELKQELIQLAKDEGLEYAILVKKIKSPISGQVRRLDPMAFLTMSRRSQQGPSFTEPILVYRVFVKDGREELVRSVKLGSLSISTLRRISGASEKQVVYNTVVPTASGPMGLFSFASPGSNRGIAASFIVPKSLILEELEVENTKRDYTPKLPVVASPLVKK